MGSDQLKLICVAVRICNSASQRTSPYHGKRFKKKKGGGKTCLSTSLSCASYTGVTGSLALVAVIGIGFNA